MLRTNPIESKMQHKEKKEREILSNEVAKIQFKNFIQREVMKPCQEIRIISWVNSVCMMLSYQQNNMEGLHLAFKTSISLEKYIDHVFEDAVNKAHGKWNKWLEEKDTTHTLLNRDINRLKDEMIETLKKNTQNIVDGEMRIQKKQNGNIAFSRLYLEYDVLHPKKAPII
jgi:AAA+ ATPase superfamily predicted ATPase